jgi:hypothetical protein
LKLRVGLLRVLDLCTHLPVRQDFYEIKTCVSRWPRCGIAKIAALDALFAFVSLSYRAGTFWSPSKRVVLADGLVLGCHVKLSLHFWRHGSGLILYELCVDGQLKELAAKVGLAVMIATIIVMLLFAFAPKPVPV